MKNTINSTSNKTKRKHLELACYRLPNKKSESRNYVYGWGKCTKMTDVYAFIGWIVEKAYYKITFTYLQCYEWYFNTFKEWKEKVKENENIVACFEMGDYRYEVVLEYVAR